MVLLPEMGASCVEEHPICTSRATTLEDEATSLVFEAILAANSVKKMRKRGKGSKLFLIS